MRVFISNVLIILTFCINTIVAQDFQSYYDNTNFEKYKSDNEALDHLSEGEQRIVFIGNSITEAWPILRPQFFENSNYIGRGISGQTTPQMLLRFRKDVINLNPDVVVILAGINDIAENTGHTPIEIIAENIFSMTELAMQNDIKVILCSVLPAADFPWRPGLEPVNKVIELNNLIESYAFENDIIYVDYHSAMKDAQNGLKVPEYTTADDLVHPNESGYIVMEQLIQPAISKALNDPYLSVNNLFTDHMVLQQNEEVVIWGNATAGDRVTVEGSWGAKSSSTVDNNGSWKINLTTSKAGGPYTIIISTGKESIFISEVLLGEVWLASGQSNMEMPLKGWPPRDPILNSEKEIEEAEYPDIRMFTVANSYSIKKENDVEGKWKVCKPHNAKDFSATAYFFARRLHKELGIPIGIIESTWGGTPAESWVSSECIKELGDFNDVLDALQDPEREKNTNDWYGQWEKISFPDKMENWHTIDLGDTQLASAEYEDQNWKTINLPGRLDFHNDQDLNGAFWFRRDFVLNDLEGDYNFQMGVVDDMDVVYINGEKIGSTVYDFTNNRSYSIPLSHLKKGENSIAIRVIDTGGPGSISDFIKITNESGDQIHLEGPWKFVNIAEFYKSKIYKYDLSRVANLVRPDIIDPNAYTATTLFNAMIHPLLNYKIKGAIWYQGESNVGRASQYEKLFPLLITDWRERWNKEFPFYFVQIAPFRYNKSGDESLDVSQKLRDTQRKTLNLANTGMVVTLDIGNNTNIHPANKQDVGSRLAGLALANSYEKNLICSGPLYKDSFVKRKKIIIEFNHVGSGLMAKGALLSGFEIAGADKKFVSAEAEIKDNKVEVSAKSISKPIYVRYAWRDQGAASLFNIEGLPASSFTTE